MAVGTSANPMMLNHTPLGDSWVRTEKSNTSMRSDSGMTSQVFPPPSQYHMFSSPSCVGESRLSLFWMSMPMSIVSPEPSHSQSFLSTGIMIRPNGVLRSPYGEPMP